MIHREERDGGRLKTFAKRHTCMQKNPRRCRFMMDDGPPYGPGTTDSSSASKRDPVLQSTGTAPLPLGSPAGRSLPLRCCVCYYSRFYIVVAIFFCSQRRLFLRGVARLGRKTFISYLFGWPASHPPPRFRCTSSPFRSSILEADKTNRILIKTTYFR